LEAAIRNGGAIKSIFRTDTFCTDEDMLDYDSNEELAGLQLKQIKELEERESDHSSGHL